MFTNHDLKKLIIPLMIEQVLTAMMGTVDTVMLTFAGNAALSGVSLVDSINKLVVFLLSALATGGAVVCSQHLGHRDVHGASNAARQMLIATLALSVAIAVPCLLLRRWLLGLIFGTVENAVMENAAMYFLVTAFSYPFIALFDAGSAIFRATGNSKLPMRISIVSNLVNIAGNAILIFVFKLGALGAAISTLVSLVLAAVTVMYFITRKDETIQVGNLLKLRPDFKVIKRVLSIGVPVGVENAMFQFGKLVVQSTVSTLGTTAMAANAIVVTVEAFTSMPSMGIGLGLVTVAGQCMGAGRPDEAEKYSKKLTLWSAAVLLAVNWAVWFCVKPLTGITGMEHEAAALTCSVMFVITLVKPLLWPLAFTPENGMRAAGDVKFLMIASSVSMWVFRVALSWYLCRYQNVGLVGIWYGYFADWLFRDIIFSIRFARGRWKRFSVIDD